MRHHSLLTPRAAIGLIAATGLLVLQGCALLSPPPPRGTSGIREAAAEALASDSTKHRHMTVDRAPREDHQPEVAIDGDEGPCLAPAAPGPPSPPLRDLLPGLHLGLVSGGGSMASGSFSRFGTAGVELGFAPASRTRVDIAVLGGPQTLTSAGRLGGGVRNAFEVAGDLSVRYALTPDRAVIVYPITGFRVGELVWDYARPIAVDDGASTHTIDSDALPTFGPYVGVGASLLRTRHFELGAHVLSGLRTYGRRTQEGLRNDAFDASSFVQLQLETLYRF